MGYGICRVQKVKAAAVGSMQYHNDRLPGEHSNPNIDHSKRGDNAEFIKHGSYRAEVNDRIDPFLDCVWSPKNPRFWGSVFLG